MRLKRTFSGIVQGLIAALFVLACMLVCLPGLKPAHAAQQDQPGPYVQARLVADTTAIVPGQPFWLGVVQTIAPEWHTYWRNPGDSGEPSVIDWALPHGLRASDIHWPAPDVIPYGPLANYGYSGEVMLLSKITPPENLQDGEVIILRAVAAWLACKDICIPEEQEVVLALPVRKAASPTAYADADNAALFAKYRARLPQDAGWDARFDVADGRLLLDIDMDGVGRDIQARFFGHDWGAEKPSAAQDVMRTDTGIRIETEWTGATPPDTDTLSGVVVFDTPPVAKSDQRAFVVKARYGVAGAPATQPGLSFYAALGLALLGGMVLNLMPCVFPVLSVKAIGLVAHGNAEARVIRRHGWIYTLGVVASFTGLAALLLGLRAGGEGIGWGFQLQSPLFITFLAYLFFAVGLNLSGFFTFGEKLAGLGNEWAAAPGDRGAFFTGVLAAVVATPCTAPFMAAALGYALTQPPVVALGVFVALGAGLALPYLALCYSPALLARLPRPGAWMERLRQFLAFPMYLSVAWLVWVLARQTDGNGVIYALSGLVMIAMAVWFHRVKKDATGDGRSGLAAVAVFIAVIIAGHSGRGVDVPAVPFAGAELAALRAEGQPVFVNMTADWCITCKMNEQVALSSRAVQQALVEKKITYMKGDWTQRNTEITKFLRSFGRSGVPLYVYYPAGGGDPVTLPQILTPSIVLEHLRDATEKEDTK